MNPERICFGCFQEKELGGYCPHCGFGENEEQPYLALPLGTLLNGRYMLGKVLGVGGFGITYLGYDLTLDIKVAIKEYMPSSIATRNSDRYNVTLTGRTEDDYRQGMENFLEEAKILAKLQNTPNIVSVQNYFKENNTAYFVMEYIDGMSLKDYLADQGGKIPYVQALAILEPIMEALVQVHALNLLHRDISPDNIYITSRGESRLLDFGAARFALGDGKSVSVILKHGYAPEEQYSSHGNQGPWTDVYAMGATFYRCITGMLPPDSVERIRVDALKAPSELGIIIPRHIEQAILKALAVKTEDRFPNMGALLRALRGEVPVREQVVAGVSKRAQDPALGQSSYDAEDAAGRRHGLFSRLAAVCKAKPAIAGLAGGGLLVVIALCIILPITLSGSKEGTLPGGAAVGEVPGVSAEVATPGSTAEPSVPPVSVPELETRDLGILSASIGVPSDYVVSADGFSFANEERGCAVTTSFVWNLGVPIYTLSDIESHLDEIIASVMLGFDVADYTIHSAEYGAVGGRDAYRVYFEGTDAAGVSMDMLYLAVQGENPFGCYIILGAWSKGDEAGGQEIGDILQSFRCNGVPDITYSMWYSENIGIKFIIDDSLAIGSVWETEIQLENGVAEIIAIYPTEAAMEVGLGDISSPDSGGVEIGYVSEYGYSTPEEMLDGNADSVEASGGIVGQRYAADSGGVEWLCQNYSIGSFDFSSAAAVIEGRVFYLSAMYNDTSQEAVVALCNQVMASVRPL
ncbi:MAG: serine/threonine protein kinase [Oscillospiraceae bacterium]